jgi:broad specificity phosphatase PhoE
MTVFLWVRHASHDLLGARLAGRMPGITLNARGWLEARRLATWLSGARIDVLYTSPLERCLETAAAIARTIGRAPRVLDALTEIDFGAWTGRTFDDLASDPDWVRFNTKRSEAPVPEGESMRDAEARALDAARRLCRHHRGETMVLVSHGDVIKAVFAHALGAGLDHLSRFDIDPASVSTLVDEGGRWHVIAMNEGPEPGHGRIVRARIPRSLGVTTPGSR